MSIGLSEAAAPVAAKTVAASGAAAAAADELPRLLQWLLASWRVVQQSLQPDTWLAAAGMQWTELRVMVHRTRAEGKACGRLGAAQLGALLPAFVRELNAREV